MCGIIGYIADKNITGEGRKTAGILFRNLLVMDERRGKDSTGFFAFNAVTKKAVLRKSLLPASQWALKPETTDRLLIPFNEGYNIFLGHNRAANAGKVDLYRAHPIISNGNFFVVGIHNGKFTEDFTEKAYEKLKKERGDEFVREKLGLKHEVSDTQVFIEYLALEMEKKQKRKRLYEVVKEILEGLEENDSSYYAIKSSFGFDWREKNNAYALLLFTHEEEYPIFVRNSKRPAFFTTINEGPLAGTWIFSDPKIFKDSIIPLITVLLEERYVEQAIKNIMGLPSGVIYRATPKGPEKIATIEKPKTNIANTIYSIKSYERINPVKTQDEEDYYLASPLTRGF